MQNDWHLAVAQFRLCLRHTTTEIVEAADLQHKNSSIKQNIAPHNFYFLTVKCTNWWNEERKEAHSTWSRWTAKTMWYWTIYQQDAHVSIFDVKSLSR